MTGKKQERTSQGHGDVPGLIGEEITQVYAAIETHQHRTTLCRWARFIVCELYLNKIDNCMSNFSLTLKRTLCLKSLEEIMEKHALLTVLPCVLIFF